MSPAAKLRGPVSLTLHPHARAAASARRFVASVTEGLVDDERARDLEVMVSEIVSNGVLHAETTMELVVASYDSTIRILQQINATAAVQIEFEVIPGISSVHALTARHKIPLNAIGAPVLITTGRQLAERIPQDIDTIVVLLDGGAGLDALEGSDFHIYWGAYLGTCDEVLIAGHVRDALGDIKQIRAEKRTAKGWIMDTYLLRRTQ